MNLQPEEVVSLIGVRELLAEATRRSGDRTASGRHTAVVLLDGAVEAAVGVCLGHFGARTKERDTLETLNQRLGEHLEARAGQLPGWRDANRLRRARNLTQHHQIPVDSETLQSFIAPVTTYINHVVRETFKVRLADVLFVDAITDSGVRAELEAVERALDANDVADASERIRKVFNGLVRNWSSPRRSMPAPGEPELNRAIEAHTADLREIVDALPFTVDIAELVWFQRATRSLPANPPTPADTDDMRRALNFVIGWVQRWQAYDEAHRDLTERERYRRVSLAARSTHPDGHPQWANPPNVSFRRAAPNRDAGIIVSGDLAWGTAADRVDELETWQTAIYAAANAVERSRSGVMVWFRGGVLLAEKLGKELESLEEEPFTFEVEYLIELTRRVLAESVVQREEIIERERAAADAREKRSTDAEELLRQLRGLGSPKGSESPIIGIDGARGTQTSEWWIRLNDDLGPLNTADLATRLRDWRQGKVHYSGSGLYWVVSESMSERDVLTAAGELTQHYHLVVEELRVEQKSHDERDQWVQTATNNWFQRGG